MATCQQTIQSKIDSNQINTITEMVPNTLMPLVISISQKQLFLLNITQQETVGFTINLVSSLSPTNIGVTVTIFQLIGNTIWLLGSVLVTEMVLSFQKDFPIGTYILCIGSSAVSYTGTLRGDFSGYQLYSKLSPIAYTGQALNSFELSFQYTEKKCDKLLYYSVVEGSLPEGLQMTLTGDIWGILPNLDCTKDTDNLSPSQNWYFSYNNHWQPWGNQWRFKLRVWIAEDPSVVEEQWFCIRIHNNWSLDRDNQPPIEYEDIEVDYIAEEPIPDADCCEEESVEPFIPQTIPVSLCPCETETTAEKQVVLKFLKWYKSIIDNPPNDNNPYIKDFVDKFRSSDYYKSMLVKVGVEVETLSPEERERKAVSDLISFYNSQLVDGLRRSEDIDFIMLNLKEEENQKLPITIVSTSGTHLDISLHKANNI